MNKNVLENFFDKMLDQFQTLDGKIIGEDMQPDKLRLANDDRGAWINHLADQYLKKEELDETPEELDISLQDIIDELVKREVEKIHGES